MRSVYTETLICTNTLYLKLKWSVGLKWVWESRIPRDGRRGPSKTSVSKKKQRVRMTLKFSFCFVRLNYEVQGFVY